MPVLLALALLLPPTAECLALPGPVAVDYAPTGRFAGHWGVDFGLPPGTEVRAVLPGVVSFSGHVVDNLSVTLRHGADMRTSYSFLASAASREGDEVAQGDVVGRSAYAHTLPAWHLSLRIGNLYEDPLQLFGCHTAPGSAVWLVSFTRPSSLYAVGRAERHPGRNI